MKKEDEVYYRLHARSQAFNSLVEKTVIFLKSVLENHHNPYCSYSTGKDSLVMLSLCQKVFPDMCTMYHDSGVELPESHDIMKKAEQYFKITIHIVISPVDVLKIYKKKGVFAEGANKDYAWTPAMMNPIMVWAQKHKRDVAFIGLRKQESRPRKILLLKRGKYFYAKTKHIHEAFPLADWTAQDVFAFIVSRGLECLLHPAYSKTRFVQSPEDIRVSWYCDPSMIKKGYFVWLRYYYPILFQSLRKQFPEVCSYA